ncbi:MAG: MmcQ/YjbR family DNA-binding protein [Opitutales bacterium]|nr:MmcQ/YjbR family DNA-binding protein [Opitutales bacterium]
MEPDQLRQLFLSFPETTEETPFGEGVAVYKTAGKMFALLSWEDNPFRINLKCNPQKAEELRDQYSCVLPGYHMNKKHWNTVITDKSVEDDLLTEWIEHSFECVIKGMPKAKRTELLKMWHESDKAPASAESDEMRESLKKGI